MVSVYKNEEQFDDLDVAPFFKQETSISKLDQQVIKKSDQNIKKLLKKIDKQSVQYVEWMRKKQAERQKKGYTSVHGMYHQDRDNQQTTDNTSNKRSQIIDRKKSTYTFQNSQRLSRSGSRAESARPGTAMADRNQPPNMESLYKGTATYLDYKRRTSPVNLKLLIDRLQNPKTFIQYQDLEEISQSRQATLQSAREDLSLLQNQLKYIDREKLKVDQDFMQTQIFYNRGIIPQSHRLSTNPEDIADKEEMLQETLRIRQNSNSQYLKALSSSRKSIDQSQLLAKRSSIFKQYSMKGLNGQNYRNSRVKNESAIKENQIRMLFKNIKEQKEKQLQGRYQDLEKSQDSLNNALQRVKDEEMRGRLEKYANQLFKTTDSKKRQKSQTNSKNNTDVIRILNLDPGPSKKPKLYKIYNDSQPIEKKVGDLIMLTQRAGGNIRNHQKGLKSEIENRETKTKQQEQLRSGKNLIYKQIVQNQHKNHKSLSRTINADLSNFDQSQNSKVYDSEGNIVNKTRALRERFYQRQISQYGQKPSNVMVDKNLQKVLEYVTQDMQTAMPKRNALNILQSIKSDVKKANYLDTFIVPSKQIS
ncbi:UNKNOWN [Stylonychia lemnae]|uniref:Uncharacterized protein n=1 Tax=Stylonychia lemnae TaxID=5949 RepID=A0A078AE32_STYLE|nr:UNKNOWN [Stylonychia lemnae]|eukprot:CDW79173.1 UNKNOWN [Stylonychia lemnae]